MKRLTSKLLAMDLNTTTYTEMYNGKMLVVPTGGQEPWEDYSPIYYEERLRYEIYKG